MENSFEDSFCVAYFSRRVDVHDNNGFFILPVTSAYCTPFSLFLSLTKLLIGGRADLLEFKSRHEIQKNLTTLINSFCRSSTLACLRDLCLALFLKHIKTLPQKQRRREHQSFMLPNVHYMKIVHNTVHVVL